MTEITESIVISSASEEENEAPDILVNNRGKGKKPT